MRIITSSLAALVLCAGALPAYAQTPPTVPPMQCDKPSDYVPVGGGTAEQQNRVKKRMETYKTCVNDYATGLDAKIKDLTAQAQAYQDAANKAVTDYNAYNKDMVARLNSTDSNGGGSAAAGAPKSGY
jgi:hypothetical protein